MYLKRSITVNWGNIPSQELDYGPVNLFSGGNGSGKTTTADALQTLMTAAHENLFHFNPGQDETTQKGRGGKQVRTLASYVLDCLEQIIQQERVHNQLADRLLTANDKGSTLLQRVGERVTLRGQAELPPEFRLPRVT